MEQRNKFAYSRAIKLGPAVGDWTTIQYRDSELDEIHISTIHNINFDSLPKEKLKYVHYLHYRLAEKLAKRLSGDMDIKVELHTIMAAQVTYEDFLNSQPERVIQSNFMIKDIGKVNVVLDWGLADSIVDRLTGGKGEESDTETFSEIELSVLQAQMEQLIPPFSHSWKSVFDSEKIKMEFVCGRYVQDKKISLREAYVVFTYYLYFGKGELKKIVWAYPSEVLRKLLLLKQGIDNPIKKRIVFQPRTLKGLKVEVKAVLGKATLTMKELKQLQIGDVIPLDSSIHAPIELVVGDKTRFSAQAGVVNHRLCMQLIFMDPETQVQRIPEKQVIEKAEDEVVFSHGPASISYTDEQRPVSRQPAPLVVPEPVQEESDDEEPMSMFSEPFLENPLSEKWEDTEEEPEETRFEEAVHEDDHEDDDELEYDDNDEEGLEEEEPLIDPFEPEEATSFEEDQEDEEDNEDDHDDDQDEEEDFDEPLEEEVPVPVSTQTEHEEDDFSWDDLDTKF